MKYLIGIIMLLSTIFLTSCGSISDEAVLDILNGDISHMVRCQELNDIPSNIELDLTKYLTTEKDTTIEILAVYTDINANRKVIEFYKHTADNVIKGYIDITYDNDSITNVILY